MDKAESRKWGFVNIAVGAGNCFICNLFTPMSPKLSYTSTAVVFVSLLIGAGFALAELKDEAQVYAIMFGLVTLGSLYANPPFKTRIAFNILLGILIYIGLFIVTMLIVSSLNPNNGIVADNSGEKHHVMQMDWVWGVLVGVVVSPFAVSIYHYKVPHHKLLESLLALGFVAAAIIARIR